MGGIEYFIGIGFLMSLQERIRAKQIKALQQQIAALHARLERSEERVVNAVYASADSSAEEIIRVMP